MNRSPTSPGCTQALRWLNDFRDRELSRDDAQWVEAHLLRCEGCARSYAADASWVRELKIRARTMPVPRGLVSRVRARLKRTARTTRWPP